jgi:hypothetical protein
MIFFEQPPLIRNEKKKIGPKAVLINEPTRGKKS